MKEHKSDYDEYVEKYCRTHRISREEAEDHYLVREYKKYLEENERDGVEDLQDMRC